MSKLRRRCPPYEGGQPFLYFCFAEKDSEAVFPLLEHLYRRGVRIWYTTETTANLQKLGRQQERINHASLVVVFLTENARRDTTLKNSLLYAKQGKPVIAIDTDDGDNELVFGLTSEVRHISGRPGRNRDVVEAELIRTEGFSQELIGDPPRRGARMKKATLFLLIAALLTAGVSWWGYKEYGWFVTPLPTESPDPDAPTATPTPRPTPTPDPDTVSFPDKEFTADVRKATRTGSITEESLAEITKLNLTKLPEDLSLLEQLPNLEKIGLPQDQAAAALTRLDGSYILVLSPEEVETP